MALMSELSAARWAVISGRGVEATGLTYDDAVIFMRELEGEKIFGLCVVTDEAAARDDARVARRKSRSPKSQVSSPKSQISKLKS